jgi:two-component system, OmpR family, phosphate regulon response regulator OmpR
MKPMPDPTTSETATTSTPAATRAGEVPADNAPHILVVDDDQRIRDLLSRFLLENGFRVTSANDAASARSALRGLAFDLIILDVMMPGEDGVTFARSLKENSTVPICMLTARDQLESRIEGLEAGVDDYIAKPFEPRELILRIKNLLRRGQARPEQRDEVRMGEFTFHLGRGELRSATETIKITERERDLLRLFAQRPGLPIQRHELASDDSTGSERAIDVQINRLRRKIEADPSNPIYLQTVRGKGYILYSD